MILIKESDNQVTDAYRYKGCDKTGYLETVIEHIFTDASGTCSVEIDSRNFGWVVRNEEVAVDRRKHGYEGQWCNAESDAERIERTNSGCL